MGGVEATVSVEPASPGPALATEPCMHCGAALAHDQRYCLECGAPRTYLSGLQQLDGLRAAAVPASHGPSMANGSPYQPGVPGPYGMEGPPYPPVGGSPAGAGGSRWGGAAGLIAGVGVLLLAMGVGVLIGRSGSSAGKAAPVPPAQVITVDQAGTAAGTETGASHPAAPTSTAPHGSQKSSSKSDASGKRGSSSGVGESIQKPAPPSVLKNEKNQSGGSFEQKSKNLPNVISTG